MKRSLLSFVLVSGLILSACQAPTGTSTEPEGSAETTKIDSTIAEAILDMPELSVFVTAMKSAGLTSTFSSPGPITVFAPTNDAFDALPEGAISNLLHPENKEMLEWIIAYHVVPEVVMIGEFFEGGLPTIKGEELSIMDDGSFLYIDNAKIVSGDIITNNGIIHLIDAVLLPPEDDQDAQDSQGAQDSPSVAPDGAMEGRQEMVEGDFGEVLMEKDDGEKMEMEESMMEDKGMEDLGVMEKEEPVVMESEPAKEPEAPKVMSSTYTSYREGVIGNGETSVLFFAAAWCPSCQKNDGKLSSWYGQSVPTISTYKLDYDTATALKQQFGVVQQDTFVKIDGAGNVLDIVSFPTESVLKGLVGA